MKLKMEKKGAKKFNRNKFKKILEDENTHVMDLLTTFDVPDSIEDEEMDSMFLLDSKKSNKNSVKNIKSKAATTNPAQDPDELEERLEMIKNKLKSKKNKSSNRGVKKKEMKIKKEKELKKKLISVRKSLKNEKIKGGNLVKEEKEDEKDSSVVKHIKPIFNEEGKIVFSKFDFASHPGAKVKKSKREKVMKNPRDILKKMKEEKEKIAELEKKGEKEKIQDLKEKTTWKKVFDKVEGKKVKDDPKLLYKALKRKKDSKQKSKKEWKERERKVEENIAIRQKKRQENIEKKLKEKKTKKLKELSKKGRVIPGF